MVETFVYFSYMIIKNFSDFNLHIQYSSFFCFWFISYEIWILLNYYKVF